MFFYIENYRGSVSSVSPIVLYISGFCPHSLRVGIFRDSLIPLGIGGEILKAISLVGSPDDDIQTTSTTTRPRCSRCKKQAKTLISYSELGGEFVGGSFCFSCVMAQRIKTAIKTAEEKLGKKLGIK